MIVPEWLTHVCIAGLGLACGWAWRGVVAREWLRKNREPGRLCGRSNHAREDLVER